MVINMSISWSALFRQIMRRENHAPFTFIGEIYDRVYTDERLKRAFMNMVTK